jgi:hypothetical protein
MLTADERAHFEAFGYTVLAADDLSSELDAALAEAARCFDEVYPGHTDDFKKKLVIPMMSDQFTPASLRFLQHPAMFETVQGILGPGFVTKPVKTTRFTGTTGWHRDCYRGLRGVKFTCYLEQHSPGPIQFVLVPGSHHAVIGEYVRSLLAIDRRDLFRADDMARVATRNPARTLPPHVPAQTLHLEPARLLLFDLNLWHAVPTRENRLHWGVTFLAAPADEHERADAVAHLAEYLAEYTEPYPQEKLTYFPSSWLVPDPTPPLARALHESGVLDGLESKFPDRVGTTARGAG